MTEDSQQQAGPGPRKSYSRPQVTLLHVTATASGAAPSCSEGGPPPLTSASYYVGECCCQP